jgi:hypothetical protein
VYVVHCRGPAPSKGVQLSQFVGKGTLLGFDVLDHWNQTVNERAIANETKKLDAKGKRALAEKLLAQAAEDEAKEPIAR